MSNKNHTVSSSSVSRRRNKQSRGTWTMGEDESLTRAVEIHGAKNWKKIAESVPGRSDVQCLHRWQKVLNPDLVKGPWTEEEDNKVRDLVKIHGPKKWSVIASHLPGRIGKQCRERWTNHLDPAIKKGNWEPWEDDMIISLQKDLGNKWARIAKHLPGRTDNAVKNRFNSTISRRIRQQRPSPGKKRSTQKSKSSSTGSKSKLSKSGERIDDEDRNSDEDDMSVDDDEDSPDETENIAAGFDSEPDDKDETENIDDIEGLESEDATPNKVSSRGSKHSAFAQRDSFDTSHSGLRTKIPQSPSSPTQHEGVSSPNTPNGRTLESFSFSESPYLSPAPLPFSPLSRQNSNSAFTSTKRNSPPSILKKRKSNSWSSPPLAKRQRLTTLFSAPINMNSPELSTSLSASPFHSPLSTSPSPQRIESPIKESNHLSHVRRQLLSYYTQEAESNLAESLQKDKLEAAPSEACGAQEAGSGAVIECSLSNPKKTLPIDKGLMTLQMLQKTVCKTTPLMERVNSFLSPKNNLRKLNSTTPENCPVAFEGLTTLVKGIES